MTTSVVDANFIYDAPKPISTRLDKVAQFARDTFNSVSEATQDAKPAAIRASKATAKVGGIFAAISAIFLAFFTMLCAMLCN